MRLISTPPKRTVGSDAAGVAGIVDKGLIPGMPVTRLAPTWNALPQAASGHSSRNGESGSTSSSMRSRAVSLPRAWWRSTYLDPPPPSALASSASISVSFVVRADAASL